MGIYIPVIYNGQPSALVGRSSLFSTQKGDMFCARRGKGENVLFIHSLGITPCSFEWRNPFRALSTSARVWALDLPGYGRSEKRCEGYAAIDYIKAIKDFLVKRIHAPTILVASGICAAYALFVAYSLPVFVKGVVISGGYTSSGDIEYYKGKRGLSPQSITELFTRDEIERAVLDTASPLLTHEQLQAITDEVQFCIKDSEYASWAIASFFNGACDISLIHIIRDIACPVVAIEGARPFTPSLPNIKRVTAQAQSILPHIDSPDLITMEIKELLSIKHEV